MTITAPTAVGSADRQLRPRHYLMCPPHHFAVAYAINPWMDPSLSVDPRLASAQWSSLVEAYRAAGHRVDLLDPEPGLPDMVFTANGATVIGGQVLLARFAHPERASEASRHESWHRRNGILYGAAGVSIPQAVNEGEGDFAVLADVVLAGHGFRTSAAAHAELAAVAGRPVVSLELADPRFYHLDVALAVLDDERRHIAYYPAAFTAASRRLLEVAFPDAILADDADAYAFGLNAVSDGLNVFLPVGAWHFAEQLAAAGYRPIPIDLSELRKGGGAVKCCTQEIRARTPQLRSEAGADQGDTGLTSDVTTSRE